MLSHLPALKSAIFSAAVDLQWRHVLPGESLAPRIGGEQTGGSFSVTEAVIAPQAGPPLHVHHDADEWLYVLGGRIDFICDGRRFQGGPGDMVGIPRGSRHAFRNLSDDPARLLGILTPSGFEQMLFAMQGRPPADIVQLGAEYGLEIVGPPLNYADDLRLHAGASADR